MRTKINILLASALIISAILFSCNNINESIQRDLFITPKPASFTIPIITSTESGTVIGSVDIEDLDLNSLIKNQAEKFGITNVKNIRIKEFNLELLDTNNLNNIQNIENINIKIQTTTQTAQSIAVANPSNAKAAKLTIPIISGSSDVKPFLTSPTFNYSLSGKLRVATTKELKAQISATYTVTVGL